MISLHTVLLCLSFLSALLSHPFLCLPPSVLGCHSLSFIPPLFMLLLCCLLPVANNWTACLCSVFVYVCCALAFATTGSVFVCVCLCLMCMSICLVDSPHHTSHVGCWNMRHNHQRTSLCLTCVHCS